MIPVLWLLDGALVLLVLAVAALAIHHPKPFASVALFIAYGLLLSLIWLRLEAPDVALAEAAIGAGITGALMIGSLARIRAGNSEVAAVSGPRFFFGLPILGVFAVTAYVVAGLSSASSSLAEVMTDHLPATGLGNPVNAVLLDFRAFDTLLEVGVLVLALVGAWSMSGRCWGGRPDNFATSHRTEPQLTLLLKVLVPLALMSAAYLFWVGADEPGGAFQAGTILAATAVLLVLARSLSMPPQEAAWPRWLAVLGFLTFAAVGLLSFFIQGAFLDYPPAWSKPFIIAIEFCLTISIAMILFFLASGLPPLGSSRSDS